MSKHKPNILLITTDQQRFDTVAPYASPFMRTPHYDILCRRGVAFTSAYADCPICVPARISIMSGKYASSHNMTDNGQTSKVMGHEGTLPSLLCKLGYQTAAIGKMHFGTQRVRHGFGEMIIPEDYYIEMGRSGSILQPMRHGLGQNELYPSMATVPECRTLTSWIAEKCVEYISERKDPTLPFFLWCSFSKPHPPLDPPEPYYSMYRNCDIPKPSYGDWSEDDICPEPFKRFRQQWSSDKIPVEVIKEARAAYYGLITQVDYNMGRVFGALQDLGIFDDTMIIYTSDHGEYLGDHHAAGKFFFHEASAHVPFVMKLPKSWNSKCHGTIVSSVVTHADILPTCVAAAGGTVLNDVDGQNLIALINGDLRKPREYLEGFCRCKGRESYMLTDGRWKYIWYPEGGREQLFDLENDRTEQNDLAGIVEYNKKLFILREELIKRHSEKQLDTVVNGELVVLPLKGDTERDRRQNTLGGINTEYYKVDVRH